MWGYNWYVVCVDVCPCLHDSVNKVYLSMQQSRVGLLIQYINNDTLRTEIYTMQNLHLLT